MWVYFGDLGGALDLRSVDVSRLPFLKGTVERGGGGLFLGLGSQGPEEGSPHRPLCPVGSRGTGAAGPEGEHGRGVEETPAERETHPHGA